MFPRASGSTSSGAVVLALALGLSSLHTQILPVQTEWPGRVQLGPYDRVGFVRLRKVGSTAVHLHLERVSLCSRPSFFSLPPPFFITAYICILP